PENDFTVDEKVTLRRIVNHTAGLTVWGFPGYDPNGEWPTAPELLDGKGNTDPVRVYREPGFDWQYSGGGYTVMQVALEDVSGKDFTTLMAERVLKPLEMTHSTYAQPLPAALRSNVALGYRNSGDVVSGGAHIYPEQAAAGLWTTPSDLAQYLIAVREMARGQAGLLEPETATMMLTPGKNNHGLGPAISSADDGSRFGHGGSNEGFKCNMFASLDGGYGAIVMTNADPGFALGQEIFATLAEHYGWPGFEPDVKTVLPKTPAELETYAGTYQLNGFGKIFVAVDDDALLISADFDEDRDRFLPESEHGFFDAQDRTSLAFELDEDGEAAVLIYSGRFRANRIED
ncbi:MAG: serine hydrolase, partial [Planctomycetota bacterium]